MKILSPRVHGIFDYLVVLAFVLAPSVVGLDGVPAKIAYALAAIHLLLTLLTEFPVGLIRIVPLKLHGAIELIVSVALVLLPWLLSFSGDAVARNFYVGAGIAIFVVWLVTDYRGSKS